MRTVLRVMILLPFFVAASVSAQVDARLLRMPAISQTDIAFVYAGDIWVVPKTGGTAMRLTTPAGPESFPRFSPDGSRIAFTGDYDGNEDIYILPTTGGMPERVTYHPMPDRMLQWYADGKELLFASGRESYRNRFSQLYEVPATGGLPQKLPVPYGEFASISADGSLLAFVPEGRDFRTWKRYRGGMASRIWLYNLRKNTSREVGGDGPNYSQPMLHGGTLFFLSDRGPAKRYNIWAMNLTDGDMRQVTTFTDYDVEFPSIGPSDIVFQAGGLLYRLDLATEKSHEVPVKVVTDESTLRPRAEKVARYIHDATLSPSGKRVIFQARGDLFSVPAEHGPTFDLTRSPGTAERWPSWSPDGTWVAYFSDRSGEYELTLRRADGTGGERTVTHLGPGFRYHIFWSPDSTKIAFVDQSMAINVCDVKTGAVKAIDHGIDLFEGGLERFRANWSPDSRYVVYSRDRDDRVSAVFLYDTEKSELHTLTTGFAENDDPVFDPDGKYLYYLSARTFKPSYAAMDNSWIYANVTNIVAVPLRKNVASPLAPRNDVEGAGNGAAKDGSADKEKKAAKPEKGKAATKDEEAKKAPEPVTIDFEGFESRAVILPPEAGNYAGLAAIKGKVFYRRLPRTGSADEKSPLVYYDLDEREEKTVLGDVDDYVFSADGKKILVVAKKTFAIVEPSPGQKMDKPLATDGLEMTVDPRAEWHQIFTDAWRFYRDFFYDPNMQGVDWNAMRASYGKLLDQCVTRDDVNWVLGELIGELNSSHTYRGGGDLEHPEHRAVGLLGADFALENGAYRITRIVDGAPWVKDARAPLAEPGVDVKVGDYLLAVNGVPVDTSKSPFAAFAGLADETVELTVNSTPSAEGARKVLVKTVDSEMKLRNLAWIAANRAKVDKATDGRVGYIYVQDTSLGGQDELYRQFLGQFTKQGLIIDERFNSGGQIPDRFIELLNRPVLSYWAVRDGKDWQWPPVAHHGPYVMLINGWSGSGGDAFPYYFRLAGLGPLVGTRTWGGLIGISGAPQLIDGGRVTVPTFRIYSTKGDWVIEGHGVDPDIKVVDDPAKMRNGGDPQLDRAIQEIMTSLEGNPPVAPKRPAYQNRAH